MNELIDVCTLGVCFEVHKSLRLGNWELLEGNDKETQNEYGEIIFVYDNMIMALIHYCSKIWFSYERIKKRKTDILQF